MIRVLLLVLFLANIIGCVFHAIAILAVQNQWETNTWLIHKNLDKSNWQTRFVTSIYFAIITM